MGVEESNLDLGSVREWAGSGAMMLTGPADGAPLGPPVRMVPRLRWLSGVLRLHAERQGIGALVDTLQLLVDRAVDVRSLPAGRGQLRGIDASHPSPTTGGSRWRWPGSRTSTWSRHGWG